MGQHSRGGLSHSMHTGLSALRAWGSIGSPVLAGRDASWCWEWGLLGSKGTGHLCEWLHKEGILYVPSCMGERH